MDGKEYIGCCGAYCKTCRSLTREKCKGCKLGFNDGDRNINRTRCNIKKCCFRDNKFETCADCQKLDSCNHMENWYKKEQGKYRSYKKFLDYIKENGYSKFIKTAESWKNWFGEFNEGK
jgi:hypothetical protein